MSTRQRVLRARDALLNGSGKVSYFRERGISEEAIKRAFIGYETGAFLYPCIGRSGGLLGVHCKSEGRDEKGKRQQWWGGTQRTCPIRGTASPRR